MLNSIVGKALTLFVMVAFFFSTSCTSTKVLTSQPDTLQNELKYGDRIKITTKSGQFWKITISSLSSEAIFGEMGQQIPFNEITQIERIQGAPVRTAFAVILGIPILLGLFGYAYLVVTCSSGCFGE